MADLDQLSSLDVPPGVVGDVHASGELGSAQHGVPARRISTVSAWILPRSAMKTILSATPQTSITLRNAPEARFSSVDQAPFHNVAHLFFVRRLSRAPTHASEKVTPSTPRRSSNAANCALRNGSVSLGPVARRDSHVHVFAPPTTAVRCRMAPSSTRDFSATRRSFRSISGRPRSSASGATEFEMEARDRAGHHLQTTSME